MGGAVMRSSAGSGSGSGSDDNGVFGPASGGGTPGVPDGVDDLSLPAPVYPRESRLRGEQGTVMIEVVVDAGGAPTFRILDDAGYPRLAQAALAAMKKARFRATGVSYRLTKPFVFTLRRTH